MRKVLSQAIIGMSLTDCNPDGLPPVLILLKYFAIYLLIYSSLTRLFQCFKNLLILQLFFLTFIVAFSFYNLTKFIASNVSFVLRLSHYLRNVFGFSSLVLVAPQGLCGMEMVYADG
jgi:hypothetical protein